MGKMTLLVLRKQVSPLPHEKSPSALPPALHDTVRRYFADLTDLERLFWPELSVIDVEFGHPVLFTWANKLFLGSLRGMGESESDWNSGDWKRVRMSE